MLSSFLRVTRMSWLTSLFDGLNVVFVVVFWSLSSSSLSSSSSLIYSPYISFFFVFVNFVVVFVVVVVVVVIFVVVVLILGVVSPSRSLTPVTSFFSISFYCLCLSPFLPVIIDMSVLVADTRLYTLLYRSVRPSVRPSVSNIPELRAFLLHYCPCQTFHGCTAAYPALFCVTLYLLLLVSLCIMWLSVCVSVGLTVNLSVCA